MPEYGFSPVSGANPNLTRSIELAFNAVGVGDLAAFKNHAFELADSLNRDKVAVDNINKAMSGMIAELGPAIKQFQSLNAITDESAKRFGALSNVAFMKGTDINTQLANLKVFRQEMEAALRSLSNPQTYYAKTTGLGIGVGGIGANDKGIFPQWGELTREQQALVQREASAQASFARQATLVMEDIVAHYARTLEVAKVQDADTIAQKRIQSAEERKITELKAQISVEESNKVSALRKELSSIQERQKLALQAEIKQREINDAMGVLAAEYRTMGISLAKAGFSQQGNIWWNSRTNGPIDPNMVALLRGSLTDIQNGTGYARQYTTGDALFAGIQAKYQMPAAARTQLMQHLEERFGVLSGGAYPGSAPQETSTQHLFARTAVALSVLYSAQRTINDTLRMSRAIEETAARIQAITGKIYPGQDYISNRYLLQDDARTAAYKFGRKPGEMMDAYENIFQAADLPTRQGVQVGDIAAKIAQETKQSVETITNILMGAHNAFGLYGEDLLKFSDQLVKTWADGVLTFEQAEAGLGKIFQVARNAGFSGVEGPNSLQAIMALTAAGTKMAGTPGNNMTMIARFLSEMTRPEVTGKLAMQGIGYDPTQPWDTLMGIMSAEKSWRASGRGSFIQGSGVFGRELARRGGAAIYAQLPYILEQLTELGDASGYVEHAFSKTMDTSTARANRLAAALDNINSIVGDDLLHVLDAIIRPTNVWLDSLERLNDINPIIKTAIDSLRVMQEISAAVLMSSMALRAGGTLLGVSSPTLSVSPGATGFAAAKTIPMGMMANIGMQGYGIFQALTGLGATPTTQQAFAQDLNYLLANGQKQEAAALRMPGSGFNPLLLGRVAWPLLALAGADLVGKNLGQNMLRWSGGKQRDVEDSMFQYKGLLTYNRDIRGAQSYAEAQIITNQFVTTFENLASKYGISADKFITINGNVAKSFEELQTVLQGLTLADFQSDFNSLLEKINVAAAAQEKATTTDYNARTISRSLGFVPGIIGELGALTTLAVDKNAYPGFGNTFLSAIGYTEYQQKLQEIQDNRKESLEIVEREQKKLADASSQETEEQVRIQKIREDAATTIKETLDEYKKESAALKEQNDIQAKIKRLTTEQADAALETQLREKAVAAALKVMESNVGDAAGVLEEVFNDPEYSQFKEFMLESITQLAVMQETLKGINSMLQNVAIMDKQLSEAFSAYDTSIRQATNRQTTYNDTMLQLMGLTGGMFEGPAGELANILIGGSGSAVQTNQAMMAFGTEADRVSKAMDYVEIKKKNARIQLDAKIQRGIASGSPMSDEEIAYEELLFSNEWSGQGLKNKQRQEVEKLFPAASGIQQGLMGQLSTVFQYAQWAQQYSGIDPSSGEPRGIPRMLKPQIDALMAQVQDSFGRDPVAAWKEFVLGLDPEDKQSLWSMDGGFKAMEDFFNVIESQYNGSLATAITNEPAKIAQLLATLRTKLEEANTLSPGGDWLQNWLSINDQLDTLNMTTINDIIANFDDVKSASEQLATILNDVATKLEGIDFQKIIQDAITNVQTEGLADSLRLIDQEKTARINAATQRQQQVTDLQAKRAEYESLNGKMKPGQMPLEFYADWAKAQAYKQELVDKAMNTQYPDMAKYPTDAEYKYMADLGWGDKERIDLALTRGTGVTYNYDDEIVEIDKQITQLNTELEKLNSALPYSDVANLAPLPTTFVGPTQGNGLPLPGGNFVDSLNLPPTSVMLSDKQSLQGLLDDPALREEIITKAKTQVDQTCALVASTLYEYVYPWMKNNPSPADASDTADWLLKNAEKYGYKATRVTSVEDMQLGDFGVFVNAQTGEPVHGGISRGGNRWWDNQNFDYTRGAGKSPFGYGVHLEASAQEQAATKQESAAQTQMTAASTMLSAVNSIASSINGMISAAVQAAQAAQTAAQGSISGGVARAPIVTGTGPQGIVSSDTGLVIPSIPADTSMMPSYAEQDMGRWIQIGEDGNCGGGT
jgi:hypothetical protein